jgi:hypothetical protein
MEVPEIFAQRDIGCKEHISRKLVKFTGEFPGMEIYDVVTLFEFVKLLKYNDRNDYIVLLKVVNAFIIVQKYVGVNDKKFFIVFFGHGK